MLFLRFNTEKNIKFPAKNPDNCPSNILPQFFQLFIIISGIFINEYFKNKCDGTQNLL